jgi:hypothetical protein
MANDHRGLPKADILREDVALDQAIALIEAKFGGIDSFQPEPKAPRTSSMALTQPAGALHPRADVARTKASVFPMSALAKIVPLGSQVGSWLLPALAVVFGAVIAVTGAAIVMRQPPRPIAVDTLEGRPEIASVGDSSNPRRGIKSTLKNSFNPEAASRPDEKQLMLQTGSEAFTQAVAASIYTSREIARAAMLISSDNLPNPEISFGSTMWSSIPPMLGRPASIAVKADADIPNLRLHATMTLRKNLDPALQATYTIELKFTFAAGSPITGIKDVEPEMRNLNLTASDPLRNARVKITDAYFLMALIEDDHNAARSFDLMTTRVCFDFPLLLNDDRIAKLVFEKSKSGKDIIARAFEIWK